MSIRMMFYHIINLFQDMLWKSNFFTEMKS